MLALPDGLSTKLRVGFGGLWTVYACTYLDSFTGIGYSQHPSKLGSGSLLPKGSVWPVLWVLRSLKFDNKRFRQPIEKLPHKEALLDV